MLQTGTWTTVNTANASGGTYLYSSGSVDDTLTIDFYGTSIEVIYVQDPNFGSFTVEIDNTAVRTVTATGASTVFDVHSVFDYLDDGPHTLRIMGIQGTVAIDAFEAALPPLFLPTMTPSPTPVGWTPPSGGVPESFAIYEPIELPTSGCPSEQGQAEAFTLIVTDTLTEVANMSGLAAAITAANNGTVTTPHTICLKEGGVDDYVLTQTVVINSDINIYSSGDTNKIVKGADLFDGALFDIKVGRTVEFSHITIVDANHSGYGGGIINAGTLRIYDSNLSSHKAALGGAGIYNTGTLYITRSSLSFNTSDVTTGSGGVGAAVFNDGIFTAYCSQFHNNYGKYRGALANGLFNDGATMAVNQSSFANNTGFYQIGFPSDIQNASSQNTIDATSNYWFNGASVTPSIVDTNDPLAHNPTVPTSPGFNPDCGGQPRPLLQSEDIEISFAIQHPREGEFSVQTSEEVEQSGLNNAPYIPVYDRVTNATQFEVSLTNTTNSPINDLTRVVMIWTWTEKNLHGATNRGETPIACSSPPVGEVDDIWWCNLLVERELDYPIELYKNTVPDRAGDCNRIVINSSGQYDTGCSVSTYTTPFDAQKAIPKEQCVAYEPPYEEVICGLLWWDVRDEHTDLSIGAGETITLPQVPYNILHSGIIDFQIIVERGDPEAYAWSEVTHEDFKLKIPITQMVQDAVPANGVEEPSFRDSRIESVIFWLVYFETSEGRWEHPDIIANTASTVTPPEALSTDFLRISPYCDGNGNNAGDNEKPDEEWDGTWPPGEDTWRERDILSFNHCSPDFPDNQPEGDVDTYQAAMMTYTFLNGFLDRERQHGPVGYAGFAFSTRNFAYMDDDEGFWGYGENLCELDSYSEALADDEALDSFDNRLQWMDDFLNCLQDENITDPVALKVRETHTRLMPRIRQAMSDFVANRDNSEFYPVMGALTYKAANTPRLGGDGNCIKDPNDSDKCLFKSVTTFVAGFEIVLVDEQERTAYCGGSIEQDHVTTAYDGIPDINCGNPYRNFVDELRFTYTPSLRTTVLRPVLWAESSGYRWVSLSLQIGQYPLIINEIVVDNFMGRNIPR